MSDSQQKPWSDNPSAPMISYDLYFFEKVWFAGNFVSCSILYGARKELTPTKLSSCAHFVCPVILGIVIVLFFKCMVALFSPEHRRGDRIKWGLVSYTMAMFSLVTIGTALQLNLQSISYIDNSQFPGVEGVIPPGPIGYQDLTAPKAIAIIQNVVFILSNWLADVGSWSAFCLMPCSPARVPDANSSSSIVAISSTP